MSEKKPRCAEHTVRIVAGRGTQVRCQLSENHSGIRHMAKVGNHTIQWRRGE